MLTFVTFKWSPPPGYRSAFEGKHVDVLRRMVARHYRKPHRFVLVTDDPRGVHEKDVELFELWPDFSTLRNPSGIKNPSCYRRLKLFARNAGGWLGERFVCLDLDTVITADITPLFEEECDFRIWRSSTSGNPYNGSLWMLRAGARPQVWEDFDPSSSPFETKRAGFYGSDQAWIAHKLGRQERTWGPEDGVYSFRNDLKAGGLPVDARIVFFHGAIDPWSSQAQRLPWVREHWR